MKHILTLLLILISSVSAAEDMKVLRPAEESEFVGYWRIILIPDEKMNLKIRNKDTGFADSCQFLIHKPDGYWFNITMTNGAGDEEAKRRCPTTSKEDVDLLLFAAQAPNRYKWRKLNTPMFIVEDTLSKGHQAWAVDYATKDASLPNYFDFEKGDLVMNMAMPVGPSQVVLAWRMVLRPVLAKPKTSIPTVNMDVAR